MSDIKEYTEAAAALIRMHAETQRDVSDTYLTLGEVQAWERAEGIANAMVRAAELLREDANPPYDAKAAAANLLAWEVYKYLDDLDAKRIADTEGMIEALEAYDAIDDKGN